MSEQTNTQQQGITLPEVRSTPTWAKDALLTITGYEWEALQNGLAAVVEAQQAAQAVLSRNIVDGVITMDFEKLDAKTLKYGAMTDEEKAPYIESFKTTIEAVKKQQAEKQKEAVENTAKILEKEEGLKVAFKK